MMSLPLIVLRGALPCAGIGALIGALESIPLGATSTLMPSLIDALVIGLFSILSFATAGFVIGLLVGAMAHLILRSAAVSRGLATQVGITTMLLVLYLFAPVGLEEWTTGRAWAAGVLFVLAPFLGLTTYFISGRLYRIEEFGGQLPIPVWPIFPVLVLVVQAVGLGVAVNRDLGGQDALPSDARILLLVVQSDNATWRPDPSFVEEAGELSEGVAANNRSDTLLASAFSGLPPSRHHVFDEAHRLLRTRELLAPTLADAEYATAAFVSSADLRGRSGLAYGFHIYDDTHYFGVPGLERQRFAGDVLGLLGEDEADRPNADTIEAYLAWRGRLTESETTQPHFAVVQLTDGPELDEQVARAVEVNQRSADVQYTSVIIARVGGLASKGQHPLHDSVVRSPVWIWQSTPPAVKRVERQVRSQDLFATVLKTAGVAAQHQAESTSLLGYLDGSKRADLISELVGKSERGVWWVGSRTRLRKVVLPLRGEMSYFDLTNDPDERVDLRAGDRKAFSVEEEAAARLDVKVGHRLKRAGAIAE